MLHLAFESWKLRAQQHAELLCLPPDIWAEDDPYDVGAYAVAQFKAGVGAEAFIEDVFGEDLAQRQHDDQMAAEAELEGLFEGADDEH